jgi:4-amino-4-deoxy-L-arabinose transferase-like glycosyltransferase
VKPLYIFILIAALALAARLYLLSKTDSSNIYIPWYTVASDAVDYDAIASSIVTGNGFSLEGVPTAYRAPLYPAFLAALYIPFGIHAFGAVRMAQILIGIVSLWTLWRLGKTLNIEAAGLVAAAIFAIHPLSAIYDLSILTENLALLFTILITLCVAQFSINSRRIWMTFALALTALAALLRPETLMLFPLLAAWTWYVSGWSLGGAVKKLWPGALIAFAVLAPWTVRNLVVLRQFVPISNVGGNTAMDAIEYHKLGEYGVQGGLDEGILVGSGDNVPFNRTGWGQYFELWKRHPGYMIHLIAGKFLYWIGPSVKYDRALIRIPLEIGEFLWMLLGLTAITAGIFYDRWRAICVWSALLFIAYSAVFCTIALPVHRYRLTAIEPLLVLAACGIMAQSIKSFADRQSQNTVKRS